MASRVPQPLNIFATAGHAVARYPERCDISIFQQEFIVATYFIRHLPEQIYQLFSLSSLSSRVPFREEVFYKIEQQLDEAYRFGRITKEQQSAFCAHLLSLAYAIQFYDLAKIAEQSRLIAQLNAIAKIEMPMFEKACDAAVEFILKSHLNHPYTPMSNAWCGLALAEPMDVFRKNVVCFFSSGVINREQYIKLNQTLYALSLSKTREEGLAQLAEIERLLKGRYQFKLDCTSGLLSRDQLEKIVGEALLPGVFISLPISAVSPLGIGLTMGLVVVSMLLVLSALVLAALAIDGLTYTFNKWSYNRSIDKFSRAAQGFFNAAEGGPEADKLLSQQYNREVARSYYLENRITEAGDIQPLVVQEAVAVAPPPPPPPPENEGENLQTPMVL